MEAVELNEKQAWYLGKQQVRTDARLVYISLTVRLKVKVFSGLVRGRPDCSCTMGSCLSCSREPFMEVLPTEVLSTEVAAEAECAERVNAGQHRKVCAVSHCEGPSGWVGGVGRAD